MKIWIVKTGEPVPYIEEERGSRFLRAGQMAQYLSKADHDVTWITGQFDHQRKTQRNVETDREIDRDDGPNLLFLASSGYQRHISVRRFFDHWQIGRAFRKIAPTLSKPDIIVCAYPTIDLAFEVVQFGQKYDVPTVLDIRDLWPDVLSERLQSQLKHFPEFLAETAIWPYERKARIALGHATRITAITQAMLEWGQDKGKRTVLQSDEDFFVYQSKLISQQPSATPGSKVEHYLNGKHLGQNSDKTRIVWVGNIVADTDAQTLLTSIQNLSDNARKSIDFVICGRGALAPAFEELSEQYSNVIYFEWLEADDLSFLLNQSHIGLLCYLDRPDFQMSIPNKVVDYLAASMRVVTNLSGEVERLLGEHNILEHYPTGDSEALKRLFEKIAENRIQYLNRPAKAAELFDHYFDAKRNMKKLEDELLKLI